MSDMNVEAKINDLNNKIKEIENRPTEVYSRIVGYYRSVKNWNNGKSAEYKVRKTFMEPETTPCQPPIVNSENMSAETVAEAEAVEETVAAEEAFEKAEDDGQADLFASDEVSEPVGEQTNKTRYSFFFRNTCPNCPPVKELLSSMEWEGKHINVDEEEGLNAAVENNVFTAPTVILYSGDGEELFRTDNAEGLKNYVESNVGAAAAV